ncbi:BACON domain-containing carbohydrate-binding protein [uncultured Phocaeicola sp.]|jgi:hypothetical protein|uniref:BACON domain-containing protein n=1 Tax=uncultured Phocaeicola sp. TaxID=990718 RepID=UPI002632C2B6|nr:BACON domain-containing carbohydrate-binding protein [uncultured Phocaeicola sp.]
MNKFGFKTIDSFTFDECERLISKIKSEGNIPDDELMERYNSLLNTLIRDDDNLFKSCSTKGDYNKYLNSFPTASYTTLYQPRHVTDAKWKIKKIEQIESENKKKKRKKIIKISAISFSGLILIFLFVCWLNYSPVSVLDFPEEIILSKYGEVKSINVSTNAPIEDIGLKGISGDRDWLKIEREYGTYTFAAERNPYGERVATYEISAPDKLFGYQISRKRKTVKVIQEAGYPSYIDLDKSSISFDKNGKSLSGSSSFIITTDGVLNDAVSFPDWISVVLDSIDNNTIRCTLSVGKNEKGKNTGKITVKSGSISKSLNITQQSGLANFIRVDKTNITVPTTYETIEYVNIMTDGTSWFVDSVPDWISAYIEDDTTLKLKIDGNNSGANKGKVLVKSNNGHSASISISQPSALATYFRVDERTIKASVSGMSKTIPVKTNGKTWSVQNSPYWLTARADCDSKELYISIPSNHYGTVHKGEIILTSNNNHQVTIKVEQDGNPSNFSVSREVVYFSKEADSDIITVYNDSKMNVSASSDVGWIDCYVTNSNLVIEVGDNKRSGRHSGTVTIKCGNKTQKVTVKQNGYIPCWNQNCIGGKVYGPYGWVSYCGVCGGSGGQESKW